MASLPTSGDNDDIELQYALPPSLLCLSLILPYTSFTDSLYSSLPSQCPQLAHCHVGLTEQPHEPAYQRVHALWAQRLPLLRHRLAAGVWCNDAKTVEDQRLDRRWQHGMGVHVGEYN